MLNNRLKLLCSFFCRKKERKGKGPILGNECCYGANRRIASSNEEYAKKSSGQKIATRHLAIILTPTNYLGLLGKDKTFTKHPSVRSRNMVIPRQCSQSYVLKRKIMHWRIYKANNIKTCLVILQRFTKKAQNGVTLLSHIEQAAAERVYRESFMAEQRNRHRLLTLFNPNYFELLLPLERKRETDLPFLSVHIHRHIAKTKRWRLSVWKNARYFHGLLHLPNHGCVVSRLGSIYNVADSLAGYQTCYISIYSGLGGNGFSAAAAAVVTTAYTHTLSQHTTEARSRSKALSLAGERRNR